MLISQQVFSIVINKGMQRMKVVRVRFICRSGQISGANEAFLYCLLVGEEAGVIAVHVLSISQFDAFIAVC